MKFLLLLSIIFANISISNQNTTYNNFSYSVEHFISNVNEEFLNKDTSVELELSKLIAKYDSMLTDSIYSSDELCKISRLKNATISMLEDYSFQNKSRNYSSASLQTAITSCIAYFNLLNYDLSVELLTFARDNTDLDCNYTPVLYADVFESSVFENVYNNNLYESTSSFPKGGSTNDNDLYYSIHSFNYYKSESKRVIEIRDRYDYSYTSNIESTDIQGQMVKMIYHAQEEGLITPYFVSIIKKYDDLPIEFYTENLYIKMPYDEYYEDIVTLGSVEHKDYSITFDNPGEKIIQTFGNVDSIIELYDSYSNLLCSNDDYGYELNSLINYSFEAKVRYVIRIKYFNVKAGVTKLSIIPAHDLKKNNVSTIDEYEDIFSISSLDTYIFTPCYNGFSTLLTFSPSIKSDYIITTIGATDTYMYLIDPRCPDRILNSNYDDDSGENSNALIEKRLSCETTYLIICARPTIHDTYQTTNLYISML